MLSECLLPALTSKRLQGLLDTLLDADLLLVRLQRRQHQRLPRARALHDRLVLLRPRDPGADDEVDVVQQNDLPAAVSAVHIQKLVQETNVGLVSVERLGISECKNSGSLVFTVVSTMLLDVMTQSVLNEGRG
jgi:hypothetical protein